MKELIGFWLICLVVIIVLVFVLGDELPTKEKVIFVIVAMALLALLIVGVLIMVGGV